MIPLDFILFVPPAIAAVALARLAWWAACGVLAVADFLDDPWKVARAMGVFRG